METPLSQGKRKKEENANRRKKEADQSAQKWGRREKKLPIMTFVKASSARPREARQKQKTPGVEKREGKEGGEGTKETGKTATPMKGPRQGGKVINTFPRRTNEDSQVRRGQRREVEL